MELPEASTAFYAWGAEQGIPSSIAEYWITLARRAERWLRRHRRVSLLDMSEDDLRAFLRTRSAERTPRDVRYALDAVLEFLDDHGLLFHRFCGGQPPRACDIDPPAAMAGAEEHRCWRCMVQSFMWGRGGRVALSVTGVTLALVKIVDQGPGC